MQNLVQRIASQRWRAAWTSRHTDGGSAVDKFKRRWEAPGLAVVIKSEANVRVTLFMRDAARERWRQRAASRAGFRYQQHAPPARLPSTTVSYYTCGYGEARKKGQPDPPAGFGVVAVTGGCGHDHVGGQRIAALGGPIVAGVYPHVRTTTSNLGHLVAFIRALEWALVDPDTRGQPVCMRYESAYAANVVSGVWCAKKHKEVAAHGRALWAQLKRKLDGKLWMHHSGHASRGHMHTQYALELARCGQRGEHECTRTPPAGPTAAPRPQRQRDDGTAGGGVREGELALFTDGACKGNAHAATRSCPAGWGVAVVKDIPAGSTRGGSVLAELYGPVVLDASSLSFLGATVGSNNTGELSGICRALGWLSSQAVGASPPLPPAVICYDSEYAAMQTQGLWRAKKNKALIQRAQATLAEARRSREVRFLHIKGHSGHVWNDKADALANRGAAGLSSDGSSTRRSRSI